MSSGACICAVGSVSTWTYGTGWGSVVREEASLCGNDADADLFKDTLFL